MSDPIAAQHQAFDPIPTTGWSDPVRASSWIQTAFTPRDGSVFQLVLDGTQLSIQAGAQVLGPAKSIPSGAFGALSYVVVASDGEMKKWVRAMAEINSAPIWISDSWEDRTQQHLEPVGRDLTETDRTTLDALRHLDGEATAAQLSERLSIEPAAATNRLTKLAHKGFVFRQSRSKRDGDLFSVPLFSKPHVEPMHESPTNVTAPVTLELPEGLRRDVDRLAAERNVSPDQLLAHAWLSFLQANSTQIENDRRSLQELSDDDYLRQVAPDLVDTPND